MIGITRMFFHKGKPYSDQCKFKLVDLPPKEAQLKRLELKLLGWSLTEHYEL
tara:strand:- start:3015 stop:3170 length:156 start_codon:yes stop_codon:yes gene_type:complete